MNPLTALDDVLAGYASPRTRRLIHALIALTLLILGAVLAADGDWKAAIASLAGTLYAALNKANTPAVVLDPAGEDSEEMYPDTYEEAGGKPFPDDGGLS